MNAHFKSHSLEEDGRSALRQASIFRGGVLAGVLLLVLTMATTSCYVRSSTPTEPATAAPKGNSPYEQRGTTRDGEGAVWVDGTQG